MSDDLAPSCGDDLAPNCGDDLDQESSPLALVSLGGISYKTTLALVLSVASVTLGLPPEFLLGDEAGEVSTTVELVGASLLLGGKS